jgi:hypothetical protein
MQNRRHDWLFRVSLVLYAIDVFLAILYLPNISHGHSVPSERDALLARKRRGSVCPDLWDKGM